MRRSSSASDSSLQALSRLVPKRLRRAASPVLQQRRFLGGWLPSVAAVSRRYSLQSSPASRRLSKALSAFFISSRSRHRTPRSILMTLRGRPRKWRIDDADDSLTSKIDSDVAVEVLREASLDQSSSKPTSSRGLNRRSAASCHRRQSRRGEVVSSTVQVMRISPVGVDSAPYLTAFVASSWRAMARASVRRGVRRRQAP
jgi:hypothetical protein